MSTQQQSPLNQTQFAGQELPWGALTKMRVRKPQRDEVEDA